ncbi:hypothetical protein [Citrobacter phage Tr1]|nr:hypothetical protein [Citrobacter phage Tr1]
MNKEFQRTGDAMRTPPSNIEWTPGILEEKCLEDFREATGKAVAELLDKGYSRFEIDSLMHSDVTMEILMRVF